MESEVLPPDRLIQNQRGQRMLAAIAFTGGVNISSRMLADEDHTLSLIQRDLQFMREQCQQFEGRVLKSTGDGLMMCFVSALDAVRCALEIQMTFARARVSLSPSDVLSHKIGIHLGDVYISESDAMGIGVNIAAQLQLEAEPESVFMSQTVYDAVGTTLSMDATYLGVKQLQNSQEMLSIYKIRPPGSSEIATAEFSNNHSFSIDSDDVTSGASRDLTLDFLEPTKLLLERITGELEQDSSLISIKKLILFACMNTWESDRTKLEKLKLSGLIQELIELAPTLKQLRSLMDELIESIDHSPEFVPVINTIFDQVSKLYPGYQDTSTAKYRELARALELNRQIVRIKKLIVYVCQKHWENDQSVIDKLNFANLIQDLHQLNPTLAELKSTLQTTIKTISKQVEYTLIANDILDKVKKLYPNDPYEAPIEVEPTLQPMPPAVSLAPPVIEQPIKQPINQPIVQPIEQTKDEGDRNPDPSTNSKQLPPLDLFDLRLQIMKYGNPLRAKMLIFCLLNNRSTFEEYDWPELKTHELTDLLTQLLDTHKNPVELESKLNVIALNVDEPAENAHTASAIAAMVKSIYES